MRKLIPALLTLAVLFLACFALAEDNLIVNGDFSNVEDGMPVSWRRAMWYTDEGVSLLTVEEDGYDGSCVSVFNVAKNDARFVQTVPVEPDSYYYITAMCRAEGISPDLKGATLSADGTFTYSNELFDTAGQWEKLELYGHTGAEQTELNLFIRVGGYGSENAGRAWFDDVSMVKLDALPAGVTAQELEKPAATTSTDDVAEDEKPARSTETWLLMAFLWALAAIAIFRKTGRGKSQADWKYTYGMVFITLAALLVRLVLAERVPGYNTDINCFTAWGQRMLENGPARFYSEGWCDYPPLYMWMLTPIAALSSLFGLATRSGGQLILIKLWPILFDIAAAWLIFFKGRKQLGARAAMMLAAFFALNPAVFTDSAAWGQIDSVFTLMVALAALDADDDRYITSLVWFALAMLVKPQALLFAPIGLIAILCRLVRGKDKRKVRGALIGLGGALALLLFFGAVSAGFSEGIAGPIVWLKELYGGTMNGYAYMDVNALNLWYLLDMNWNGMDAHRIASLCAWAAFALSYIYCAVLYIRSKQPKSLTLVGGTLIMLICAFGPMMHERYVYPALILLLLAFIETRDWRLLVSLIALSFTLFLNEVLVLQGGMTAYNDGHLQSAENWLNYPLCVLVILNTLFMLYTSADICLRGHVMVMVGQEAPDETPARRRLMTPVDHKLHLKKLDAALMAGMTLIYSVVAFTNLGSMKAPQTTWTSRDTGESIVFDLGDVERFKMLYYGNICSSNFTVEFSNDGATWTQPVYAQYNQGLIFRWIWFRPVDQDNNTLNEATIVPDDGSPFVAYNGYEGESYPYQTARYVRITSVQPGLKLMEVGFDDEEGNALPVTMIEYPDGAEALTDEQDTVPPAPGYYVGSYFDEIYHPRTAYEHLNGLQTYEYTHPPLGKVMMMIGIQLFGMTPFGWRFMGTLMGVLMVPLMYLMVKQLTKSTKLSFIAMFLLSVDSMHFTQTRLATIDSYSVFWIMLMYFFMFRFVQMPWRTKKEYRRSLVVLGLCGISMGLGWATKWICLYASAGLAILFFWTLWRHGREAVEARADERLGMGEYADAFPLRAVKTLLFCLVFFVAIPLVIYYFSYYWHLQFNGVHSIGQMFSLDRVKEIWNLQLSMYRYHAGLGGDTHPFRSPWYQWPVIAWPMWYYSGSDFVADGYVSSISCMGNPAVFWFCLAALFFVAIRAAWVRRARKAYTMTLVGFLSQFLPWVLVPRSTFIYHYFASVPFIIIAGVLTLGWVLGHSKKAFIAMSAVLMGIALALFILFYPLESGYPVLRTYAQHLRWFNWVNF